MLLKTLTFIASTSAALILGACDSKPNVSFDTLEDARNTGRENALFNAATYRAENPRLEGTRIVSHGDSTQTNECPQGDGWASVSFLNVTGEGKGKEVEKYVAKCSTVSSALGCYLDKDFANKPFARQENRCDTSLPFPLKRIAK
jgi:hypothetical protein